MNGKNLGFAVCASFCNFQNAANELTKLVKDGNNLQCILSEHSSGIDTRFGSAANWTKTFADITGKQPITDIVGAEPIGPQKMFDALIVCPCTGNTLAKLANGITDNTVTMAVKSHLRGGRPVIIALSTNDGLAATAQNIAQLVNTKHYYFVPLIQDDPYKKPNSLVCNYSAVLDTVEAALCGKQTRPLFDC